MEGLFMGFGVVYKRVIFIVRRNFFYLEDLGFKFKRLGLKSLDICLFWSCCFIYLMMFLFWFVNMIGLCFVRSFRSMMLKL